MSKKHTFRNIIFSGITSLVLVACGNTEPTKQPSAPIDPQVSVARVVNERITEWDEFTGRLQAPQTVTLIPRVSGYIENVLFEEGAVVGKGDVLFRIDPRAFKAEVDRLKAELQSAESAFIQAQNDFTRAETLSEQRAVSIEILDGRLARKQQTSATVASVSAALALAELDLSYTQVTAPISGRVSYALITEGNFVTAGQSALTSLVSMDKMYAYFDVDEQTYLKYAQLAESGKRSDTRDVAANPVYMALASEINFEHIGNVDFVDNAVNQQTGTIRIRATFPNHDHALLPGLFARVKLTGSNSYQGILIDEKAIGTDLNRKFVLVVDQDNRLEYRNVVLGEKNNGLRIITDGLTPTDTIVVNGLQRVRPKMKIQPKLVDMTSQEALTALRQQQKLLDQTSNELTAQADKTLAERG
ncbi:efflux RND transporter periplasmic adaptor subunit [Paraglaciecola polaris]|uniref:Efflux transporter, RND family, MFP subunit n=1 Tax=Paraglaciecola polaris LMG 21857 TaxID=1129793 RepID=K6ZTE4_9ALTE|nr:efflux RND transporter periplasmic adaptor subunit [Paraglaciecola polaris]GAC32098.1 efflux transporter, RND family, MFP subunit [Paraglaciecola polaris LMG 21857]